MSWGITNYPFTTVAGQDATISGQDPGLVFTGTETGNEQQTIREVNGDLWLLTNCDLNKTSQLWTQTNAAYPSWALRFSGGTNGQVYRYYQVSGAVPWGLTATGGAPTGWNSASALAINGPLSITGNIISSGGYVQAGVNNSGGFSPVGGDLAAARTTSSGALQLGGTGAVALIDFGASQAGTLTYTLGGNAINRLNSNGVLYGMNRAVASSLNVLTPYASVYNLSSAGAVNAIATAAWIYVGSLTAAGTTTTITISDTNAYFNNVACGFVSDATATAAVPMLISGAAISWTSVNGHVYRYCMIGY